MIPRYFQQNIPERLAVEALRGRENQYGLSGKSFEHPTSGTLVKELKR